MRFFLAFLTSFFLCFTAYGSVDDGDYGALEYDGLYNASSFCEIRVAIDVIRNFGSYDEAFGWCQQFSFSQTGCYVNQNQRGGFDGIIDFDDIFRGSSNNFRDARVAAYRNYFNWLEGFRIYQLPFAVNLNFNCKR